MTHPPHFRRNFGALLLDFLAFGVGHAFISSHTVLPNFIGTLTDNGILIGFSGVILPLGHFAVQLITARWVGRTPRKKPWLIWPSLTGRLVVGMVALGIVLLAGSPGWLLVLVLAGTLAFALIDGLTGLAWIDILGRAIPNERRGRFFGLGEAGIAVIVMALALFSVIENILGPGGPAYPYNYALLFGLAFAILMLGWVGLALVREPPPEKPLTPAPGFREYWPFLRRLLREDAHYRHFVITRIVLGFAGLAAPFYIGYTTGKLGYEDGFAVQTSLLALTIGQIAGSVLLGWLTERFGSRAVIRLVSVLGILAPVVAWGAGLGPSALVYIAFGLLGGMNLAFTFGYLNWIIEYAPVEQGPIYVGLTNTLSTLGVLSPLVGGYILNVTASFEVLFGVALALSALGAYLALGLSEPRHKAWQKHALAEAAD